MLQLNQGEICRSSRITFHVSVVAKFPLKEQVLCTLIICQCRLHNAVIIKEHNSDISIFNFRVIQGSPNTTNTSSQSTTQLQTIPILYTDIFVFVKRHIPENSDIQQHAWESHRSPSECWHQVVEKPSTRILRVPACTCVQRSVSSHHPVSWLHYGTRLGVSLLT